MDAKQLLFIATSAKDEYVDAEAINANLKQTLEAQKVLINDYAESMPDIDETEKQEKELNEELEKIDEQLSQSQLILTELLQSKPQASNSEQAEAIMKAILTTFQQKITELAKVGLSQNSASVSIFQMIDLEEEISKLIENLNAKQMYPETEEDNQKRVAKNKAHNAKLSQFLQLLRQILAQANAARPQQQQE